MQSCDTILDKQDRSHHHHHHHHQSMKDEAGAMTSSLKQSQPCSACGVPASAGMFLFFLISRSTRSSASITWLHRVIRDEDELLRVCSRWRMIQGAAWRFTTITRYPGMSGEQLIRLDVWPEDWFTDGGRHAAGLLSLCALRFQQIVKKRSVKFQHFSNPHYRFPEAFPKPLFHMKLHLLNTRKLEKTNKTKKNKECMLRVSSHLNTIRGQNRKKEKFSGK